MEIKNKNIVIVGGASGLGAACVTHLANLGANIAVLDLKISEKAFSVTCDITDSDNTEAAIEQIYQKFGCIHGLINCAGVAPAKRIVGREAPMPLADFEAAISINLIGSFNTMRLCSYLMRDNDPIGDSEERGFVINTASIAAEDGQIGQAAYSASKGGVVAMTLPAARELAQFGIRVVTIAPGVFSTPMMAAMPEKVHDNLCQNIPFPKRLGKPEEFAQLAAEVIRNPMLNGCTIRLDGALRMQAK